MQLGKFSGNLASRTQPLWELLSTKHAFNEVNTTLTLYYVQKKSKISAWCLSVWTGSSLTSEDRDWMHGMPKLRRKPYCHLEIFYVHTWQTFLHRNWPQATHPFSRFQTPRLSSSSYYLLQVTTHSLSNTYLGNTSTWLTLCLKPHSPPAVIQPMNN